MQTGVLISFSVANKNNHAKINRFCREFYGYKDKSNKGKYTYTREGFLTKYPHIKVQRGLIITRMEDAESIIQILSKYDADIFMREVILLHSDIQKLNEKLNEHNEQYRKKDTNTDIF
ncbi:MAG: hypothetical protein K0B02_01475 [DPANN group archaeon]|nr:hypothetical protein [DPANN group archaeon]